MTTENVDSLTLDDPGVKEAIKFSLNELRKQIMELQRGSDQPSGYGGSQLNWIEENLGPYSYVRMFRRHMTIARENLREAAKYLKPVSKPRFVPVIAARCAIENAGVARWLSEPEPEGIVRRTIERELANIIDEQRMMTLAGGSAAQYTKKKRQNLLEFVDANSLDLTEITNNYGKVNPRTLTRIMESLDEKYEAPETEGMFRVKSPWSLTSALIHGSEYPARMLASLILKDDHGQLLGVESVIISGFLEAAKNTYQEAMNRYRSLLLTETSGT